MTEPETWCTDWTAYDVPRLWEMVSAEDSREAWAQVSAWFRLRDAVDDQRERLAACRQALVEMWPPERSEASAAFVAVLDELVASMTETVQSATSTASGLAGVLQSLATAKTEIKPLYDEWLAKSNDLTPRWLDHSEDELSNKARDAMIKAETAVAQYAPMIQPPPQYELEVAPIDGNPIKIGEQLTTTSGSGSPTSAPVIPHNPPLPLPGIEPVVPETPDTPVLAGGLVPTPPTAVPPQLLAPPVPPAIAPGPSGGPLPVPAAWLVPTPRGLALAPGAVIGPTLPPGSAATPARGTPLGPAAARGAVPGVVTPSAMTSTGAIAGRPSAAAMGAGRSGHTPRHISPPAGTGYRTADGHVVSVSGLGVRPGDTPQRPPADPHDPWAVGEGIPPVVTPDPLGRHDPGPGVIGMDR